MIFALIGEHLVSFGAAVMLRALRGPLHRRRRYSPVHLRHPLGLMAIGIVATLVAQSFLHPMSARPDARHGHYVAVHQLWGEQPGFQFHGGGVAAECRARSTAGNGTGGSFEFF